MEKLKIHKFNLNFKIGVFHKLLQKKNPKIKLYTITRKYKSFSFTEF